MKRILLIALLLPTILSAQNIPNRIRVRNSSETESAANTLPDNYQITLTLTDKDGQPTEVSVVVASSSFTASIGELGLMFQGNVTVDDAGTALVGYVLGWSAGPRDGTGNVQANTNVTGSVRLKPRQEVQILRAGSRVARLSIKPLEGEAGK